MTNKPQNEVIEGLAAILYGGSLHLESPMTRAKYHGKAQAIDTYYQKHVVAELVEGLESRPKFCQYQDESGFDFDQYEKDITKWGYQVRKTLTNHHKKKGGA